MRANCTALITPTKQQDAPKPFEDTHWPRPVVEGTLLLIQCWCPEGTMHPRTLRPTQFSLSVTSITT